MFFFKLNKNLFIIRSYALNMDIIKFALCPWRASYFEFSINSTVFFYLHMQVRSCGPQRRKNLSWSHLKKNTISNTI